MSPGDVERWWWWCGVTKITRSSATAEKQASAAHVYLGTCKRCISYRLHVRPSVGSGIAYFAVAFTSFFALYTRRLTFDKHVSAVARSCNNHAQAIRHIRHLLTMDLAQTLACSLILSRIDYCNAVLHGAPSGTIHKLQRVQNNAREDRSSSAKTITRTPAAEETALVTGGAAHLL